MSERENRFVVYIDDIDRLVPNQINAICQLVKSVADFENIIYVLSYDQEVVINALNHIHKDRGADYLQKIVQVPLNLPETRPEDIRKLFHDYLNKVFDFGKTNTNEEQEKRWSKVFEGFIFKELKTVRDVKRLTNSLLFNYEQLKGEVNIVDYVFIETLKVFHSDLFSLIKENRFLFSYAAINTSNYLDLLFGNEKAKERIKEKLEQLFGSVGKRYFITEPHIKTSIFRCIS